MWHIYDVHSAQVTLYNPTVTVSYASLTVGYVNFDGHAVNRR